MVAPTGSTAGSILTANWHKVDLGRPAPAAQPAAQKNPASMTLEQALGEDKKSSWTGRFIKTVIAAALVYGGARLGKGITSEKGFLKTVKQGSEWVVNVFEGAGRKVKDLFVKPNYPNPADPSNPADLKAVKAAREWFVDEPVKKTAKSAKNSKKSTKKPTQA